MHSHYLMSAVADQHVAELRRAAARSRRKSPVLRMPASPSRARRRAGWMLVSFGLRLAVGPAAAR